MKVDIRIKTNTNTSFYYITGPGTAPDTNSTKPTDWLYAELSTLIAE